MAYHVYPITTYIINNIDLYLYDYCFECLIDKLNIYTTKTRIIYISYFIIFTHILYDLYTFTIGLRSYGSLNVTDVYLKHLFHVSIWGRLNFHETFYVEFFIY